MVSASVKILRDKGAIELRCQGHAAVVNVRGGNVRVVIKPKPENFNDALLIIGTVAVGYQLLQEAYPGYVKYYQFDTADIPAESIQTGS